LKGRNIEVAIGLESSNNMVLKNCVNKGFKVEDFVEASKKVSNYGFKEKLICF
jgi:Predicted Fe-S oxidoreductase